MRREILALRSPGEAKKMGKTVDRRQHWNSIKWAIMLDIVWTKFHRNPHLAKKLKDTGGVRIVEGNSWHDNFWGDCACGRPLCDTIGQNKLGIILMHVRESLP